MAEPEKIHLTKEVCLVERIARNDQGAFRQFYHQHSAKLAGHLFGICKNRQEAEDLAQETFLRFVKEVRCSDQPIQYPGALLHTIGRRLALNSVRDKAREMEKVKKLGALQESRPTSHNPSAAFWIESWTSGLPEKLKKLLQERLGGWTFKEIAEKSGEPPSTLKSRGALLQRELKKELQK